MNGTRPQMATRAVAGFTLIELLVSVSVLAVMLGLAAPAMGTMIADWRRDALVATFSTDLRLAKSTALRTARPAVICPSADGLDCSGQRDWRPGWIVFSDVDGDRKRDATEPLIVQRAAPTGVLTMSAPNNLENIQFRPNGMLNGLGNTLTIVPTGGRVASVRITINVVGRAYVTTQ